MSSRRARIPTALVLSGGSAPGAYQAGVLRGDSSMSQYKLDSCPRVILVTTPGRQAAGERRERRCGEARTGRPLQARIADVVSGGWIIARIRIGPRQRGHSRASIAKTRFISSAHASHLALAASDLGGVSAWVSGMAGGVASSSRSRIEPSSSIEAESGVAKDAAHARSPSIRAGVESDSGFEDD